MAASRKRRRRSRELNEKGTSSSDSEGLSDDEEKEAEAMTGQRWLARNAVEDSKGKGKAIVKDEDDESMSGSEETEDQKSYLQKEVDQVCGICLSEDGMERGKLDCCDHFFCFSCIMEWSKVESRCPMCKQRFLTVTKPAISGVTRSRSRSIRIPTRDQVYEPSEEEIRLFTDPYQNTVCTECHEAGDESLLLLCDHCDAAAHTYCVGLGHAVPRGDWYCQECMKNVACSNEDEEELRYIVHDGGDPCGTNSAWDMAVLVTDINAERIGRSRRLASSTQGARPLRRSTRRLERASRPGSNLLDNLTAESRSGFFPALFNYGAGVARTLFSERQVRASANSRFWNRFRNGESFFSRVAGDSRGSGLGRSGPELSSIPSSSVTGRSGVSTRNTSAMDVDSGEGSSAGNARAADRSAEQDEVERAWVMAEQARRLAARTPGRSQPATTSSQSALTCRGSVAAERPGREGRNQEVVVQRVRERPAQEAVLPGATSSRGGLESMLNTRSSGRDFDRKESKADQKIPGEDNHPESSNRREVSSSRSGYYLRDSHQLTMNTTTKDSCPAGGSSRQVGLRENRTQPESLQVPSVLDDKDNSRGSSGRSARRRDVTAQLDDKDNARTSGPSTRSKEASKDPNDCFRSGSSRDFGYSTRRKDARKERCSERDEEVKQLKQQCYNLVNVALKPFLDSGKIDKRQFKHIARVSTHAIFAAIDGSSESKRSTDVSLGTVICQHDGLTSSDLIPGCCESCVLRHIRKFVKNVVREKVDGF
ncbi:hypothetical protein R1sor_017838 [Riccia sorocarpa]|uniref:PHD and RING finger domain-containing protein 1 n=1 Tax=Riccia sorocarpa TaxID=122646 RepID=A0ABD3I8F5_9MARC